MTVGSSTIGSGEISAGGFSAASEMFALGDQRMALANRVSSHETPTQLAAIQQQDKKLALRQAQAQTDYEYSIALFEQNEKQRKKTLAQQQRLFEMGALFS